MDIDLARTFLEVVRCGSFIAAAERLHVTQTTVTARIHNLESQLGCRLLVRNRSGARLTDNGERFVGHASQLVQTWAAARRELPLPQGSGKLAVIGGELSLWNPLLMSWLLTLRDRHPELAIRTEVGERRTLYEKLEYGVLDIAVVHQPDYWPGMQVEQLLEEKLVLVRSTRKRGDYVYVDWGEAFRKQHDAALPEQAHARLSFDLGPLALQYLLAQGGSGYFRTRVVQQPLQQGLLRRVARAPEFAYPLYVVYPRNKDSEVLAQALAALRTVAASDAGWNRPVAA